MPLDTSIPLQAKVPESNPLATLLQVSQYKAYSTNAQAAQQGLDANRAISSAYQQATDPTTGQVDNNKLMGIISQDPAAGYKLGEVVQGINTQRQQQATLDGTRLDQAQKAQSALRTGMGSLLTKPDLSPGDIQQFADSMVKAGAIPPQVAQAELKGMPKDPAQIRPWLAQHFQSALSGEQQLSNMKPQFAQVNTGPATVAVNQNPNAIGANGQPMGVGAVGYTVNNGLAPSQLETVGQDPNGNPTVTKKDVNGRVVGVSGAPVQGQPSVPPRVIPSTETPESYAALQLSRQQANIAAGKVKEQNFNNRAIIGILDNPKTLANPTGSNASWVADLSSKIGLPTSGNFAADYNQINHYLAMQKQANEKAMGVSSDAGRATAGDATGSTHMDPVSLRKATALNDATATGLGEFNQGQEAAVKRGGIPAVREFQNAWSKYYDVNALRILNATRNGDQTEIKDVVESLGGTKSAKFQAMRRNAQMLDQLKNGIIPNGGQ